jgi:hypothetical protein
MQCLHATAQIPDYIAEDSTEYQYQIQLEIVILLAQFCYLGRSVDAKR